MARKHWTADWRGQYLCVLLVGVVGVMHAEFGVKWFNGALAGAAAISCYYIGKRSEWETR